MARILIVEDETRISDFLDRGLRAAGHTTSVAADGTTGLHLALAGDIDLVVLDLGLPDRDGLEVLADLRGSGSDVPVIVLTARGGVRDTVAGLTTGATDYVVKPFHFAELEARVALRLAESRRVTAGCAGGLAAFLALQYGAQQGGAGAPLLAGGCLLFGGLAWVLVSRARVSPYLVLYAAALFSGALGALL